MSCNPATFKGLTITLPLPSRKLSPNARVHFMAKAREAKALRRVACLTCLDSLCGARLLWPRAAEKSTFFFSRNGRHDGDNLLAMLKPVWDGFQDAGLVANDSGIIHHPAQTAIDRENPRVEIQIWKEEPHA